MSKICELCHRKVVGKAFNGIVYQGKLWHSKCFQCSVCCLRLTPATCRSHDGRTYCLTHYMSIPALAKPVPQQSAQNRFACEPIDAPWFHGQLSREEADELVKEDGDFLVRTSQNRPGDYIITVKLKSCKISFGCPRVQNGWNFGGKVVPTLHEWVQLAVDTQQPVRTMTGATVVLRHAITSDKQYEKVESSKLKLSPSAASLAGSTAATAAGANSGYDDVTVDADSTVKICSPTVAATHSKRDKVKRVNTNDFGSEDVRIDVGNLCDQKVDVIVNSVGADLNLTSGALSSVLLAAAGTGMQNELRLVAKTAIAQPGDVFVTKGYQLSCKYVIHAACGRFAVGAQSTVQGYRTLLNRVLAEADRLKAKSIAIPPIGCGRLGYPPVMVATIMTEVVTNFMEILPGSTLKDFHFVVLETDEKMVQAFSKLMLIEESDSPQTSVDVEELREVVQAQKKERLKRQSTIRAISVPEHWTMVMSGKPYEKCELSPSSKEYQDVIQNMTDRNGSPYIPSVSKIERVENLPQHQMYESSKQMMIFKNKSCTDIERILWHGTNAVALESICQYGFNRAYCGKNGVLFGNGVYCARDFSYSAQDTYSPPDAKGLKRIMQCRVLTGYFTKGNKDMVEPPEKNSGVRYDTAVDDISNPSIFVVFHDYQMYPEYVITFFC